MDSKSLQAARLWTLAQPIVSGFVTSVVRDFKDRDDLLQEIAVATFESFEAYDSDRPFVPWVMGIARNQIGLYLRKRSRDRLVFDDETINCLESAFNEISPDQAHQFDALTVCLKKLEGRAKEICRLRYFEDLTPARIGEKLAMAPNAVAKALQRIREQLKDCISKTTAGGVR